MTNEDNYVPGTWSAEYAARQLAFRARLDEEECQRIEDMVNDPPHEDW